ncbi:MAG: TetR/AcrR family transcriptional regulator [Candidatus Nanopelagicales bacterium]
MPRVSTEHLQARRRQITVAAAHLVARHGVHNTSMRDVIRASGMSAGAVYHYFPSKSDLLESIGELSLAHYRESVAAMLAERGPLGPADLMAAIAAEVVRPTEDGAELSAVGLAMWAEALHDPRVAATMVRIIKGLRGQLEQLAGTWIREGHLPAGTDSAAVAAVLYAVVPGFLLQRHVTGDVDPATIGVGVEALLGWSE